MRCSLNEKVNIKIGGDFDPPRCIRVAFPGSGGVVSRDGLCLSVLHADCMIGVKRIQLGSYLCLSVLHADCISKNARMSIRYAVEYAVSR